MPTFQLYRLAAGSPLAVTHSRKDSDLDQKSYAVEIKSPMAPHNEHVFALVTEHTTYTVLGTETAAELTPIGELLRVAVVSETERHQFELDLPRTVAESGSQVPDDYFEFGWDVLDRYFEIGPESASQVREMVVRQGQGKCSAY